VTDNYGKFLSSAELDFVIGHELGHLKARHGLKKLLLITTVFAAGAAMAYFLPVVLISFRPLFDILMTFVPILTFCFVSRRFEFAADKFSVEHTRNPQAAIQALVNLHRITQTPMHYDRITELLTTHPPLARRARAIGEMQNSRE
jgi:Zn-dependent protease with chaperone function